MKAILLLAVLALSITTACTKSSKTGDPTEDLAWLKAKKTEMASQSCTCAPSIWQETYEGRTIYETGCSAPNCLCAHFFYESDGKSVIGSEESNRQVFLSKITNRTLLWSCK